MRWQRGLLTWEWDTHLCVSTVLPFLISLPQRLPHLYPRGNDSKRQEAFVLCLMVFPGLPAVPNALLFFQLRFSTSFQVLYNNI